MAYVTPDAAITALQRLGAIREHVASRPRGFGPRFLHWTGQLHKGGPKTGLFIQIMQKTARRADPRAAVQLLDPQACQSRATSVAQLHGRACCAFTSPAISAAGLASFTEAVTITRRRAECNRTRNTRVMEIGMVGLGRMGGTWCSACATKGTGHRLRPDPDAVKEPRPRRDAALLVRRVRGQVRDKPRVVWVMVPAGRSPTKRSTSCRPADPGDTIIDGGNTNWKDRMHGPRAASKRGHVFIDAGTSGGVWGLEDGYCLMVGRRAGVFEHWRPSSRRWRRPTAAYVGPAGAGHFVKMVHNGIEYGLMQAYAEGFEIMRPNRTSANSICTRSRISGTRAASYARGCSTRRAAFEQDPDLDSCGLGRRHRRRPLDRGGGDRRFRAGAGHRPSLFARFPSRLQDAFGNKVIAALRNQFGGHAVKSEAQGGRPACPGRREPARRGASRYRGARPCCVVIFGATGDLSGRKLCRRSTTSPRQPVPAGFHLVGAGRRRFDRRRVPRDCARARSSRAHAADDQRVGRVSQRVHYVKFDFGSSTTSRPARRLDARTSTTAPAATASSTSHATRRGERSSGSSTRRVHGAAAGASCA